MLGEEPGPHDHPPPDEARRQRTAADTVDERKRVSSTRLPGVKNVALRTVGRIGHRRI